MFDFLHGFLCVCCILGCFDLFCLLSGSHCFPFSCFFITKPKGILNKVLDNGFHIHVIDSVCGKRVLTYWERRRPKMGGIFAHTLIAFIGSLHSGTMRLSFFQKYIVFYAYHKAINLTQVRISPIFPKFSNKLVPFSQILIPDTESIMCICWSYGMPGLSVQKFRHVMFRNVRTIRINY